MFSVSSIYEGAIENLSLRRALKNSEFELFFQPVVRLLDNQVIGAEALVRWRQSDQTLLYPENFLPALRRAGLMKELDTWVLERAVPVAVKAEDHQKALGLEEFHIFINLDGHQLQDQRFAHEIVTRIRNAGVTTSKIVIEISEYGLYESCKLLPSLQTLSNFGLMIALDDFGTGQSNLNQIRELPLNILKLDKSFIKNILENEIERFLLVQIQDISKVFDLHLVVEGVETKEIHDFISSIGVHCAQGYFFSKALPELEFWDWVKKYGMSPG